MKEVQSLALQMMQPCVHKCVCTTFTLLLERLHSPSGIYERIIPGDMCCVMEEMQANACDGTQQSKKEYAISMAALSRADCTLNITRTVLQSDNRTIQNLISVSVH